MEILSKMQKDYKRIFRLVFLAACALCLGRYNVLAVNGEASNENILHFDVAAPFVSLNPLDNVQSGGTSVFPLLYSHLFILTENGDLEPDLALRWRYNSDNYTWTIHLRQDAFFHNGKRVTADDVRFSLEQGFNRYKVMSFDLVKSVTVASDESIAVTLTKDNPDFIQVLSYFEIVPKPVNTQAGKEEEGPIGSGPFKFWYRNGSAEVGLAANDNYYLGPPALEGIIFHYQPDKEKSWARLLDGKTDIVEELLPKDYEMIRELKDKFYFHVYTLDYYSILLYNTKDTLFADPNVRLALSESIDVDHIIQKILRGFGVPASGPLGWRVQNAASRLREYSPKKALELLRDAGWDFEPGSRFLSKDGKYFEFTIYLFDGSEIDRRVCEYIQLCFNEIGVKAHLKAEGFDRLFQRYQGNSDFQAVLTEFLGSPSMPLFFSSLWDPTMSGKCQAGCFKDPDLTKLFIHMAHVGPSTAGRELLYEADDMIASLHPGTFLFHRKAVDAMSRRVILPHAFSLMQWGIYRLKDATIRSADTSTAGGFFFF